MSSISDRSFTPDERAELKKYVDNCVSLRQQVQDLKDAENDAVEFLAEKYDLDKSFVKRVVTSAFKVHTKSPSYVEENKEIWNEVDSFIGEMKI